MRTVMDAIPSHLNLRYLKTDMQGFDFDAISSIGADLTRFHYVKNEVDFSGNEFSQTANSTRNDFCLDHWPHMIRMGFRFLQIASNKKIFMHTASQVEALCARGEGKETLPVQFDAFWISPNCNTARPPVLRKEWPSLAAHLATCQLHSETTQSGTEPAFETDKVKDALFWAKRGKWKGIVP